MQDLIIAPAEEGKGRSFMSTVLAMVEAPLVWPTGDHENCRPVWVAFANTDTELRPFMANLVTGRKALPNTGSTRDRNARLSLSFRGTNRLELLKSAGYRVSYQRHAEGSVATAFVPDLFAIDPGMVDPDGAAFIVLQSEAWARAQNIDPKPILAHLARLRKRKWLHEEVTDAVARPFIELAHLFVAFLDRRTRCPIPPDGRFFVQLFFRCVADGLAGFSSKDRDGWCANRLAVHADGLEQLGLLPALAFRSSHDTLEPLLAEEVARFTKLTGG